jgi:nucleoside-diphosphate-sugar epimerase
VESGADVLALARTDRAARALTDRGATAVRGDLVGGGAWERAAGESELVFHAGQPRMVPPLRRRHIRRLGSEAEAGARAIASAASPHATLVLASCAMAAARGPLGIAAPARAAEGALAGLDVRVVRLPWAYGSSGFINDIARGLSLQRIRVVGPGTNHIQVIGARDAGLALIAAATAPPGAYAVAEEGAPTQMELVHHICAGRRAPRPDHLPPRMASLSMGGVVVEALLADQRVDGAPLPGFHTRQSWQTDLLEALTA